MQLLDKHWTTKIVVKDYVTIAIRWFPLTSLLILPNLHFADNQEKDNSDKTFQILPIIQHFNKVFAATLGNSMHQSIEECV